HSRECDKYRPVYYAGASGDFNPIHIDRGVGELVGLGGAILQGLCTRGWATESAGRFIGDPGQMRRVKARFSRPVSIDAAVSLEGKVTMLEGGRWVAELTAKNQRGEDVLKNTTVEASL